MCWNFIGRSRALLGMNRWKSSEWKTATSLPATHAAKSDKFTGKQAKCFEVYERRTIEVAPNDKLAADSKSAGAGLSRYQRGTGDGFPH